MQQNHPDDELANELRKRIDTLDSMEESAFGAFTRLDWVILIVIALVLPTLALVAAR